MGALPINNSMKLDHQRKMPRATPGREQCQTQTQAGEQLGRKGPMDVPGQQAQHKPAACPGS